MYEKQNFKTGQVLTAEALNHIEDGIVANEPRVFKYHADPNSDTYTVIETGEDWIHNSAVLDWLLRNGVEGVNDAELSAIGVEVVTVVDAENGTELIITLPPSQNIVASQDGTVYVTLYFSNMVGESNLSLVVVYSQNAGETTWNKEKLEIAYSEFQIVEGNPVTRGSGAYSLQQKAEPNNENNASGLCSTAFGHSNEATEHCSYAEGYDNASGGWASHVEGVENTATSDAHFAHVGGTGCTASSECAFVHGRGLKAIDEQAVFGRYNALAGGVALVVGCGNSDTDRRNAFTVPKNPSAAARVWDSRIITEIISTTYEELGRLRNSFSLIPGHFYRITDYETTTTQFATRSVGHPFDVIVLALDKNVLSENAWAIHSARDTDGYFANSNLSAWRLKYCLDNAAGRFKWADAENGKGVIYQMEDEWGNIAPFDFKNIETYWGYVIEVEKYGGRYLCLQSPDNPKQYQCIQSSPLGDNVLEFPIEHPNTGTAATNNPSTVVIYDLNIPEAGWRGIGDHVQITGPHFGESSFGDPLHAIPYVVSGDVRVTCKSPAKLLVCYVAFDDNRVGAIDIELHNLSAILVSKLPDSGGRIHVYNSARFGGLNFPLTTDERHITLMRDVGSGSQTADLTIMDATIFESASISDGEEDLMFVKNGKKVMYSAVAELVG